MEWLPRPACGTELVPVGWGLSEGLISFLDCYCRVAFKWLIQTKENYDGFYVINTMEERIYIVGGNWHRRALTGSGSEHNGRRYGNQRVDYRFLDVFNRILCDAVRVPMFRDSGSIGSSGAAWFIHSFIYSSIYLLEWFPHCCSAITAMTYSRPGFVWKNTSDERPCSWQFIAIHTLEKVLICGALSQKTTSVDLLSENIHWRQ